MSDKPKPWRPPSVTLRFSEGGVYYNYAARDGLHRTTGDLYRYGGRPPTRGQAEAAAHRALKGAFDRIMSDRKIG